ncbi:sulfite exporter TauE/SafE family protein [Roseomonas hellenica]|uniref:Probable membrane transporter protein n=2 Tax=Plastoroseomonas hellenica TaxID=2687306 RepID=A0ABS5F804_9PROT|nr:sulfite exporter TauE/SafE family protein [Plastoroseomonas hellenica]
MSMDLSSGTAIAAVFLLAGIVKGVVGLGLPTLSMGLLTLMVSPAQAATLLLAPSFVTNLWQMAVGPHFRALLIRLWPLLGAAVIGTLAGAGSLSGGNAAVAAIALGVVLIAYAAVALWAPRLKVPKAAEPWLGPLTGLATGFVTGATGVFVVPAVPYLQAIGLEKDALVQALGLSFTVSTLALGAGLALHDAFASSEILASLLALAPALIGMMLGQWIRARVEPRIFRLWFLASLAVLGGWLALAPLLQG